MPTPTSPGFPSPPPGALVLAREAGTSALGLAIVPGAARSLVRVSVLGGDGSPAAGLDVSLAAGGTTTKLPACGAGCYQSRGRDGDARPAGSTVALGASSYAFALPASLRLPDGTAIVAHAGRRLARAEDARLARAARREPDRGALHRLQGGRARPARLHDLEPLLGDHHRPPPLGPADADRAVDPFGAGSAGAAARAVLGRRVRCARDRLGHRGGTGGLGGHLLRSR